MKMHEDIVGKGRRAGNRWRREDNRGGAARVLEERELRQLLGKKKKKRFGRKSKIFPKRIFRKLSVSFLSHLAQGAFLKLFCTWLQRLTIFPSPLDNINSIVGDGVPFCHLL